jgi:hypothetical protein
LHGRLIVRKGPLDEEDVMVERSRRDGVLFLVLL